MESIDLAHTILDEARTQIQANMALHYRTSKGERWINASGRSSAAFQVVVDGENRVMLVYRGDNVAPLETIQYGYKGEVDENVIEEWKAIKESQGAKGIPQAWKVVERIREEGTERYRENEAGKPEDWVIGPVVEAAVLALNEQLPKIAVKDIKNKLFE